VIDRSDGHRRICPLTGHEARLAYRARKSRFWFTDGETAELRTFLDQYRAAKDVLPQRVKRAIFQAEASAQSRYLSDAVAHITTGLEALLNTNEEAQITAQFVKRSKQIADEFGIDGTSHTRTGRGSTTPVRRSSTVLRSSSSRRRAGTRTTRIRPTTSRRSRKPKTSFASPYGARSRMMTSAPCSKATTQSRRGGRCGHSERLLSLFGVHRLNRTIISPRDDDLAPGDSRPTALILGTGFGDRFGSSQGRSESLKEAIGTERGLT